MNKYDPGAKVESQDKGVALHVARQVWSETLVITPYTLLYSPR